MNKTLLYIDQHNHYGGGQQIYFSVLDYLSERGWNIIAMFPEGGNLKDKVVLTKYIYKPLPSVTIRDGKKSLKDYWLQLRQMPEIFSLIKKVVDEYNCTLIYTGSPRLLSPIYRVAHNKNIPIIFHFEQLYQNFVWEYYLRYYLRKKLFCKIILLSNFCKLWFENQVATLDKTVVINNWFLKKQTTKNDSLENFLPSSMAESFRYAVIGRVLPIKGQETFIKAAIMQCKIESNTEYYIIGDTAFGNDNYREKLKTLVSKSHYKNRIHFLPYIDRIDLVYPEVDCVVVPSLWDEPFGLVAVEAMYFEKPLIVSDKGELPNLAGMGEYAYIFQAGDERELLSKMDSVLHNKQETLKRSNLARIHVDNNFNESLQLSKVYDQFITCAILS